MDNDLTSNLISSSLYALSSIRNIVINSIHDKGILCLWKGYRLMCIRSIFISCIAMNVYEKSKK